MFDVAAFVLPARYPVLLVLYAWVHFCMPTALHWPRRLDRIQSRCNFKIAND